MASSALPSVERLAAKHQQVLFGDYFQILELERTADELAVARALAALLAEFDPERGAGLPPEQQSKLRLVAAVLRDAAVVLGDAGMRTRYAAQLKSSVR